MVKNVEEQWLLTGTHWRWKGKVDIVKRVLNWYNKPFFSEGGSFKSLISHNFVIKTWIHEFQIFLNTILKCWKVFVFKHAHARLICAATPHFHINASSPNTHSVFTFETLYSLSGLLLQHAIAWSPVIVFLRIPVFNNGIAAESALSN